MYLEDELTAEVYQPFSKKLEMESLPRIVFGPHAVTAAIGVLRKSDLADGRREGAWRKRGGDKNRRLSR